MKKVLSGLLAFSELINKLLGRGTCTTLAQTIDVSPVFTDGVKIKVLLNKTSPETAVAVKTPAVETTTVVTFLSVSERQAFR